MDKRIKNSRKLNREDPSLKIQPNKVQEDKRTKRNRTRSDQKRKDIEDQIKDPQK